MSPAWQELVVGGHDRGWSPVGGQPGDDGGWISQASFGQADHSRPRLRGPWCSCGVGLALTVFGSLACLDGDHVDVDGAELDRGSEAGDDIAVGQVSVQQQYLDQGAGAGGVAELGSGSSPKRLVGGSERARGAGLGKRGGSGKGAGFAGQDLQVVVECEDAIALGGRDED